jgi:hypothetical protein
MGAGPGSAPIVSGEYGRSPMKIVVSDRAAEYIRERGGKVWVWMDPRRGLVGSYVWLEAHAEPPGASRRSSFTRSSKRPHRFTTLEDEQLELHYSFARLDPPEELHFDVKGRGKRMRLEAYWNGCVFAGPDIEAPSERAAREA